MNSRRSFACVVAVCLTVPVAAKAAEITLFEGPNFQGRSITFASEVSNLDPVGFNDKASSLIVRDGIWEGCVDAYFQGSCTQFRPGEYPQLDSRLNRGISSLHIVQGQLGYHGQNQADAYYYPHEGYRDQYYGHIHEDGYNRGYYGYSYRDHGQ